MNTTYICEVYIKKIYINLDINGKKQTYASYVNSYQMRFYFYFIFIFYDWFLPFFFIIAYLILLRKYFIIVYKIAKRKILLDSSIVCKLIFHN